MQRDRERAAEPMGETHYFSRAHFLHLHFSCWSSVSRASLHISRSAKTSRVTMVKLTIIAVLLFVVCNESLSTHPANLTTPSWNNCTTNCAPCSTPGTASTPSFATPPPPVLAFINVNATVSSCQGALHLQHVFNHFNARPLCHDSSEKLESFKNMFCAHLGCDGFKGWKRSQNHTGYKIEVNGFIPKDNCITLEIMCKALPKSKELAGYKTVTGLLITGILVLLLLRFGHKRCTTLYNKLFKRRNREWIGPTQSQSVSFYRAQAGMPSSNSARYSYPALERLSVQPGREPSSNRNSDCDSYN
ncbi:uncharacterized protein [Paramormyrops kingsleyae]|uniref:uncharacterized protein n=1 Tax=Paramormyrops kingsleyae TaxID=1676925 RepID=UPI003B97957D